MKKHTLRLLTLVLFFVVFVQAGYARETITLISNPGTYIEETRTGAVAIPQADPWDKSLVNSPSGTTWIWGGGSGNTRTFREVFTIPSDAQNVKGTIHIAADNWLTIYLNGTILVNKEPGFAWVNTYSFTPKKGQNILRIAVTNYAKFYGDPAGVIYRATITYDHPADLWIEDTPPDSGVEPNTSGQDMWISRAIWIRHTDDGIAEHENPLYGQTNQVYVNIRNRGGVSSTAGAALKVYYAYASAGLSWPGNWFKVGEVALPAIAPANRQTYVASLPWNPPGEGHYCMIARIESAEEPIDESHSHSLGRYVADNNNMAWRNLNIVGPSCEDPTMLIRNIACSDGGYDETLELVFDGDEALFRDGVKVFVDLGSLWVKLFKFPSWLPGNPDVEFIDIKPAGGTRIQLLSPQAKISGIPMMPEQTAQLRFEVQIPHKFSGPGPYHLNVKQIACGQVIGGVDYDMEPCLTQCPEIHLSPLTIPCLPPDGSAIEVSQQLTAEHGQSPYTFTVTAGSLPAGLTLAPDGMLTGAISRDASGTSSFCVLISDANDCPGSRDYTVELYSCDLAFRGMTFSENGQTYTDWSQLPGYVDYSKFDAAAGQGIVTVTYAPGSVGQHSLSWDFEYLFQSLAPQRFEFITEAGGSLDAGYDQSLWIEKDTDYRISAEFGFDFLIEDADTWAEFTFVIGDLSDAPYYQLSYADPSIDSEWCQGDLTISSSVKTGQIPEPCTLALIALGLLSLYMVVKRSMKNKK